MNLIPRRELFDHDPVQMLRILRDQFDNCVESAADHPRRTDLGELQHVLHKSIEVRLLMFRQLDKQERLH